MQGEGKVMIFSISKFKYNDYIKWIGRGVTLILFLYFLTIGDSEGITGGIMLFSASLLSDIVFKLLNIKLNSGVDLTIEAFIYAALFLGKMLRFYDIFPSWDLFLHFISGTMLGFIGIIFLISKVKANTYFALPPSFKSIFGFVFGTAAAGLWEIWEFAGDVFWGLNSQGGSLYDTMTDICAGTTGSLIFSIMIFSYYKWHKLVFLGEMFEEFADLNYRD